MMDLTRLATLGHYLSAKRRRFRDRAALERYQRTRVEKALVRARETIPYYRHAPSAFAEWPVLDRASWLENFASLNTRGLTLQDCLSAAAAAEGERRFDTRLAGLSVGLSTGTSGRQGAFLTSAAERARWAGTILARALPGGLLAGARVALVLRAGGPLYETVGGGPVQFRFVDLYAPLSRQRAELATFAPTVLAAPPVLLELLAAERKAGRLAITPQRVLSIADVLDTDVAERIAQGFGVPVGQVYQATEGFLGISCGSGTLHLNEDLLVIEREELGQGRFTPIVTDLHRRSQAVIRYRLSDVLVTGSCDCGSVMQPIAAVEGRSDDVLLLERDGTEHPCYADFVRAAVLGAGVADFAVLQTGGRLELAVAPGSMWVQARTALVEALGRAGFTVPTVVEVGFDAPDPRAKRRRVRRVG